MDYQDPLEHLDEMDWMKLMDRKETREREETLEWWDHEDHLVPPMEEQQPTYDGGGLHVLL